MEFEAIRWQRSADGGAQILDVVTIDCDQGSFTMDPEVFQAIFGVALSPNKGGVYRITKKAAIEAVLD